MARAKKNDLKMDQELQRKYNKQTAQTAAEF